MARYRKFSVGALNVTIQPKHSPREYVKLIASAYKWTMQNQERGHFICIRKPHAIMINSVRPIDPEAPESGFVGEIHRFIDLADAREWFNKETGKALDDEEMKQLNIPQELAPGHNSTRFFFDPTHHRIVFLHKGADDWILSARSAQEIFAKFLINRGTQECGSINVEIEQDHEGLEEIMRLPMLKKLEIYVTRPNGDTLSKANKKIQDRLAKIGVNSEYRMLKAAKGESIDLAHDEESLIAAQAALSHGYVEAKGHHDDGRRADIATKDHPHYETREYNPEETVESFAFLAKARELAKMLFKRQ